MVSENRSGPNHVVTNGTIHAEVVPSGQVGVAAVEKVKNSRCMCVCVCVRACVCVCVVTCE